ncbi:MAG: tRNA epoxyqueuosine(34) reductase QueG [Cyclobacteriaceae bacterium]|nr:tRNA epoxyqueuosine(34) reductase QueG [Cyclobacteriaceae bacterium]
MKYSSKEKHTQLIKQKAKALGFDYCGISKAEKLETEEANLNTWLSKGFHGKMAYMENYFDLRLDPTKLVPGAKSVISLLYNYYPGHDEQAHSKYKIAKYAYGKDYHFVIKDKLKAFLDCLQEEIGEVNGRVFVDSAPVMERQWAAKSGLGWLGKNTLLINNKQGSFFFIAELILDLELEYDRPVKDYCGTCTKCLDACPTDAFADAGILDASKCISYLTIELKGAIPEEFKGTYENWVFGCDICQDICPWNRFSKRHNDSDFKKNKGVKAVVDKEWVEFTEEVFREIFKDSPVKRTKYRGLQRNINFINKKPR